MRKNIAKVIESFRAGKACKGDSKGTCSTDGKVIYSYAMPIAKRRLASSRLLDFRSKEIELIEYERAPTATTRSQVRAVQTAFSDYDAMKGEWSSKRILFVQEVKP